MTHASVSFKFKMYRGLSKLFIQDFTTYALKYVSAVEYKHQHYWFGKDTITLTFYGDINKINIVEKQLHQLLRYVI